MKTSPRCEQSRAVQVVNTRVRKIALDKLAARLRNVGDVSYNEFMLRFTTNDCEIIAFPDGRAIVKSTIDELLAKELYKEYIEDLR